MSAQHEKHSPIENVSKAFDFVGTPGYKQGFFGCLEDPVLCCATYCCPCVVVGVAVGKLNKSSFDIVSCLCSGIGAYRLRRTVQKMFGIVESEDASTCAVSLFGLCSVCQDVSELQSRGAITPLLGEKKPKTVQPDATPAMTTESTPALAKA